MDKKLLLALVLSLGTVWIFNFYVSKKYQPQPGVVAVGEASQVVPGQPIKVPTVEELYKPLKLDVEFQEAKLKVKEENFVIETDYVRAQFSTYGAVLTELDFKEHRGKNEIPLRTVQDKGRYEAEARQKGCFLLALDQETPYLYQLADRRTSPDKIELVFTTENDQWQLEKTYTFYKDTYKIDVLLGFNPKTESAPVIQPRLIFTAPFVGQLEKDDISTFSWNEFKNSLEISDLQSSEGLAWHWKSPEALFGAQGRYFVHALVGDSGRFVQRAYVKVADTKNVMPILEGPQISSKQEWTLSFYFGPKVFDHLDAVDNRLEEVLSFGWLSWLCKLLLKLLSWVYGYVGNFGLAIIIIAIMLKLPFVPLTIYSRKKMDVYQQYQPTINKIRAKYKNDMQRQQVEMMKFYKDHNLSPTGQFVGCLPLLIQMPILFSLYRVLNNYLDLYQAPLFGWITDLSSKDPMYVLPILMGIAMLWQQSLSPMKDPKMRTTMLFMPIFMTVVFANFPAGVVLYWFTNNLLTIGEDYLRKYVF